MDKGRDVDVQRRLQEHGGGVLQVRTGGPEPSRHGAGLCRRHHVPQGQGLLQNLDPLIGVFLAVLEGVGGSARILAARRIRL